jgi:ABC-type multidrug transport system fused ATPase/permease subunit
LLLATVLSSTAALVLPTMTQQVIDTLINGSLKELFTTVLPQILALATVAISANVWRARAVERLSQQALVSLRTELFDRLMRLPPAQLNQEGVGQGMSRVLNDTQTVVGTLFGTLPGLVTGTLRIILIVGAMLSIHPGLSMLALSSLPVIAWLSYRGGGQLRQASAAVRAELGHYSAHLEQALSRAKYAQAMNLEAWERHEFYAAGQRLGKEFLRFRFGQVNIETLVGVVTVLWPLAVLVAGAQEVTEGLLTPGRLVSFNLYLTSLFGPVQGISSALLDIQATSAALDRIEAIPRYDALQPDRKQVPCPAGPLQLEGVWFRHPGQDVLLRDVSFTLREGEICALVGASGVGKSTLLELILGFHQPERGRITLGGVAVQDLNLADLRKQIAWVPQDPPLFRGTLRENLIWGAADVSEAELWEAVRLAGLGSLVQRLPEGLDSPVGEKGATLSGGERQRVAIARALLRRSRILLLDEPAGHLDIQAEAALWTTLQQVKRNAAVLVVAHRLTMLHHADRIVVLQDGRLVESGNFQSLIHSNGLFALMYREAAGH